MSRKDQILLQILAPRTFVECTSRDHLVAFSANVLFEEEIAVEGEESDFRATAEHDCAGDIVDSGALYAVRIRYASRSSNGSFTSTGAPVAITLTRSNRFRSQRIT